MEQVIYRQLGFDILDVQCAASIFEAPLQDDHQDQAVESADACAGASASCASDHARAEHAHPRVLASRVLVEWGSGCTSNHQGAYSWASERGSLAWA